MQHEIKLKYNFY